MTKTTKIILWALGLATLLTALIVLGVDYGKYDYALSLAIGDPTSEFANFFANLGDGIAYMALVYGLAIIIQNIAPTSSKKKIVAFVFIALLFVVWIITNKWFIETLFVADITESTLRFYFYVVFIAAVETIATVAITSYIDKELMRKFFYFGIFAVLVVVTSQLFTQGTKLFWCRLRFRNMDTTLAHTASGFSPWWHPNWTKSAIEPYFIGGAHPEDFYKSFPSGHTASGAVTFVLIYLPLIYKNMPKWKVALCYVIPWVFTITMAFSRVVNTAHFLSDTIFGGASAFFSAVGWKWGLPKLAQKIQTAYHAKHNVEAQ